MKTSFSIPDKLWAEAIRCFPNLPASHIVQRALKQLIQEPTLKITKSEEAETAVERYARDKREALKDEAVKVYHRAIEEATQLDYADLAKKLHTLRQTPGVRTILETAYIQGHQEVYDAVTKTP